MAKQKLTITQYKIAGDSVAKNSDVDPFEVMINPEGYEIKSKIIYVKSKVLGQSGQENKFNVIVSDSIVLKSLVLDGTGVVPDAPTTTVKDQVDQLRKVTFLFVGKEHQSPVVELSWGTFHYYARLENMSVSYTLFNPDGDPLRAKVSLTFSEYLSNSEIQKRANLSSPDLTHLVEIKAGDTLPLLCHKIYKNSSYYMEVARINNLTNFRHLKAGTILNFPPLNG